MGSSPPTLPTVSSLAAATSTWADLVKEYLDWHESVTKTDSRPYALLQASSTQTLSAGTATSINFDTEVADVGNGHSGTASTYSIPSAGLWMFSAVAAFASTTTSNPVTAYIIINGGTHIAADTRLGIGGVQAFTLGGVAVCAAGDGIQLYQASTAASSTSVTTALPTLFAYRLNS